VSKDLLIIINTAAFLRSFTFGLTGVVLGIYLFRAGLSSFNIGMVVAAGLVGSALATIGVTAKADRAGRRRTLDSRRSGSPSNGLCGNVERDRHGPLGCIFS